MVQELYGFFLLYCDLHLHKDPGSPLEKLGRMDDEVHQGLGNSLEVLVSDRAVDLFVDFVFLHLLNVGLQNRPQVVSVPCVLHQHNADNLPGLPGHKSGGTVQNRV